jgi:flavin reductase (DIM6/NTAB) family NADH-FMN oxidoreductase RutF
MQKNINKSLIMAPMPVLIISTYDENNEPNAMNAAWGTQLDDDKIIVLMTNHKTTENLKLKKAFTVAFATQQTLVESDYFGIESGKNTNKIAKVGFHTHKAEHVDAPVIEEYPVSMECEVVSMEYTDGEYYLIGKIVNVLADAAVLDEKDRIDLLKLEVISYDSALHAYRAIGPVVGQAFHDGLKFK